MRLPIVLVTALALAAIAAPASPADEPAPTCARGDAQLDAGDYAAAETTFKALLGTDPCIKDGKAGLVRVKDARFAPTARLVAFNAAVAKVRRLQRAGFEAEASKEAQAIVAEYNHPLPSDVRSLTQRTSWWREILGDSVPDARSLLEAFAALVAGVLTLVILLRIVANGVGRCVKTVRLSGFNGLSDATESAVLTSALHDVLARLKDASPSAQLRSVSGTEGNFTGLPDAVLGAIPQGALIQGVLQMLDRLLPRRVRVVSGTALPVDPDKGAGLSLAISRRTGRQQAQVTVWEKDFDLEAAGSDDLAARYARLVLPVAVWLAYHPNVGSREPRLGTADWRSYASFAVAEEAQREGKRDIARHGYATALDRDAANLGARLNLGALLAHYPPVGESAADRLERLNAALKLIARVAGDTSLGSQPIWFRARYLQAVVCITLGQPRRAAAICAGTDRRLRTLPEGEQTFVDMFGWPHYVLWQSAKLLSGQRANVKPAEQRSWLSSATIYNLACFYALGYGRPAHLAEHRKLALDCLATYLSRLGDAEHQRAARAYAATDPAFAALATDARFRALTDAPPDPALVPATGDLDVKFGSWRRRLRWSLIRTRAA